MIYFDNAATSFPKPKCVIKDLNECIENYLANPGRSSHSLAIKINEQIFEARSEISKFLGLDCPERVVFCLNATMAINIALKTTIESGSHVLISDMEHNAVLRPIHKLKETKGIEYSTFSTEGNIYDNIKQKLRQNTKYIVSTVASNVTGECICCGELSKASEDFGLKLILDASQLLGHKKISLSETPCDILCAPGHKGLFGIQGVGFAVFLDDETRDSFLEGGSGSDSQNLYMPSLLPERLEAGTLPSPAIISLLSGLKYINNVGIGTIEKHIKLLTERMLEGLHSIDGIKIYGGENGVISFNVKNVPSYIIADELDSFGICVRAGLHCAPLAHKKLCTLEVGTVRISFSYLNTLNQIESFYKALSFISKKY